MTDSRPADDRLPPSSGATATDGLDRVHLFGLDLVDAESLDPVIDRILDDRHPQDGRLPLVLTPNVDIVVHLDDHPDSVEADLFRRARYCLPDGQPVVFASRWFGRPLRSRLAGSDLFAALWPRIVENGIPTVVVASSQQVVQRLEADGAPAAFVVPPFFDADDPGALAAVAEEVLAAVREVRPRLIVIGIGMPKDPRLGKAVLDGWSVDLGPLPVVMGVGGAPNMYVGLAKRAPRWVQRVGLEWFYRFAQEPRRLFRRYFVRDVQFLPILWREWRDSRRR